MLRTILTLAIVIFSVFVCSSQVLAQTRCVVEVSIGPIWYQNVLEAAGGPASLSVSAADGCEWTASTDAAWLTLEQTTGTGSDSIPVMIEPNTSTLVRYAAIVVGEHTVVATQANNAESIHLVGGKLTLWGPDNGNGSPNSEVLLETTKTGPIYVVGVSPTTCTRWEEGCPAGSTVEIRGWLADSDWATGYTPETVIQGTPHTDVYWRVTGLAFSGPSVTLPTASLETVTVNVPVTFVADMRASFADQEHSEHLPFYFASASGEGMFRLVLRGEPGPSGDWVYVAVMSMDPGGTHVDLDNHAFRKAAYASSALGSMPAEAVDGNLATSWINGGSSRAEWLMTDLGEPFMVDRILLSSDWAASNFTVVASFDGRHWTPVFTTTTGQRDILNPVFPARYVMLYLPNPSFPGQYSLSELSVYGERPTNVAMGRPVRASSGQATSFQLTDGNLATSWVSAPSDPQWVFVDLGLSRTLTRLVLRWSSSPAETYAVLSSVDGQTWTPVFFTTAGIGGSQEISLPSITARYVMVYGVSRLSAGTGYVLTELEAY